MLKLASEYQSPGQLFSGPSKRFLCCFALIVLMVPMAFMFANCRTFVETPTKDTAMEKISLYSYPKFSDDLDYHGLEHGILQSLVYLRKIPVDRVFVFGKDRYDSMHMIRSLEFFLEYIQTISFRQGS